MSWRRVGKSLQALAAHSLLFAFTVLLLLKLDHSLHYSWWVIFLPLWIFHAVVARGRFSLPAPSVPHDRHWAPCHAVVATPLLVAFELLLCVYLESIYVNRYAAVSLKIVFLPLLAFELTILVDNFRMCKALLPGDDESMSDEAIWETLPHFWVAISMVFFVAATVFTLLKLSGDVGALGWWDLFINYGIAECFAFLVCTKWSNPMIHRNSYSREVSSSSSSIGYLDWNSGFVVPAEDQSQDGFCGLPDIGGHIMKVPIIVFQVLLCMHLEGTPPGARHIPLPVLFSPLFLFQGVGVLFAASRFVEKIVLLLRSGARTGQYFTLSSRVYDLFDFLHHGSRLLGWWSIDEASREEQARLYSSTASSGSGGFRQLLGSKLKSQNLASRNTKDSKMKRFFVGFALKERLVSFSFHVGIGFFAVPAPRDARNVPFVVYLLRSTYPYMMYSFIDLNLNVYKPWKSSDIQTTGLHLFSKNTKILALLEHR